MTTLEPGSLVLVTGVNGLLGSHVADQLLHAGYKVRGSVRDPQRADWMNSFFAQRHGEGKFSLVQISDITDSQAFDAAAKGVAGIVHTSAVMDFQTGDPNQSIPQNIQGALNALEAARKEPAIKRVVFTSSAWAAITPSPDVPYTVDEKTFNTDAIAAAWAPPPYMASRAMTVYSAAKAQAEQACWKWMNENEPGFTLNVVLPATIFGKVLEPSKQGIPSTAGFVKMMFEGQGLDFLKMVRPQYFIDTQDIGRLHVAALTQPGVKSERIFGFAGPWSWNDVLNIFRKKFPGRKFVEDFPGEGRDIGKVPNARAAELLKNMGRPGFTPLEESILDNVKCFVSEQDVAVLN